MAAGTDELRERIRTAVSSREWPTVTVLSSLLAAQEELGYLPNEAIEEVASLRKASINDVWGVATFYTNFRFDPPTEHVVEVCWGPSCHVVGAAHILQQVQDDLGLTGEGDTPDGRINLRYNTCLGACSQAPVISVDHRLRGRMTVESARRARGRHREGRHVGLASYSELKEQADRRWQELVSGDRPWIRVGTAMCGHAAGAFDVFDAIASELEAQNVEANLHHVGCLGLCFAEPLVDVTRPGGPRLFFKNVSPERAPDIVRRYLVNDELPEAMTLGYLGDEPVQGVPDLGTLPAVAMQQRIALRNAGNIAPGEVLQYVANGGYAGLDRALTHMTPEEVVDEMKSSGLRGRGGAAFPTGVKWGFMVRSGPPKYILCNCEEAIRARLTTKASWRAIPTPC